MPCLLRMLACAEDSGGGLGCAEGAGMERHSSRPAAGMLAAPTGLLAPQPRAQVPHLSS